VKGLYCDGSAVTLRRDLPEVVAAEGEVVLRVRAVGLCDTDLQLARGSCDVVVDATGAARGFAAALGFARPRGTVVLKTTVAAAHTLSLAPVVIDELTVVGSRCGPFPKAIDALARKVIDVRPLLAARYPLDEAEAAFAYASQKGVAKVILDVA